MKLISLKVMVDLVIIGKLKIFHLVLTLKPYLQNAKIHCGLISQHTVYKPSFVQVGEGIKIFLC